VLDYRILSFLTGDVEDSLLGYYAAVQTGKELPLSQIILLSSTSTSLLGLLEPKMMAANPSKRP
jgi:hypothetical protein